LITPYGETVIEKGDILYILVSRSSKRELKKMLNVDE
jgi:potassium/hydrogen antiporter